MNSNKPYVIGVAGGSGSGKTFFLNCFLNHFSSEEVCLLSQDDYYIYVGKMTAEENRLHNFDLPSCIEESNFEKDVNDLLDLKTVYKKEYTFNNPNAVPKILEIKPAPILIIEGLFIYHFPNIDPLFNYRVFMDADMEIALERRLKRDLLERGYSEDDVLYKWDNHVMPAYQQYLLPHRQRCDKVINNSTNELQNVLDITEKISKELRAKINLSAI